MFNTLNKFQQKMFNTLNKFQQKVFNALNRFQQKVFNALNTFFGVLGRFEGLGCLYAFLFVPLQI